MKLLMHTCCAPCSVYCIETLRNEGIEPTLYWYNPNIHPYKEYEARRDCLKEYAEKIGAKAIFEDEYGLDDFCINVSNNISERCTNYCYPVRLKKTFEYAKQNGYTAVTTTLLYSIYQNHDYIKSLMELYSKEYGVEFLYRDFRPGFWEGHNKAKEEGLYMQKYCGCIFSEEDRYMKQKKKKQRNYNEEILEKCLPSYLENDINKLKEGLKNNVNYIDCLINEVQGSINSAWIDGDITEEQCDYLYKRYVRMEK